MDDDRKAEERTEPGADRHEALEDLDVPRGDSDEVKGGLPAVQKSSFKQAWPKKYE